jgi:ferric-dicitrate binding protein FerR (iron transport regulator)
MDTHDVTAKLMLDDSFVDWVLSEGKTDGDTWQKWLQDYSDQHESLENARKIILRLHDKKYQLTEERKDAIRKKIFDSIHSGQEATVGYTDSAKNKKRFSKFLKAAAVFLVLSSVSFLLYRVADFDKEVYYTTAYGEIKTFDLPDGSRVTLNGNSSVRFSDQQNTSKVRELWLEGEGFFDVQRLIINTNQDLHQAAKFIVHTDNLSIQVLGTRFNVKYRGDNTQVVLEEGSIQLNSTKETDPILMQPDDLVEVNANGKYIYQQKVKTSKYIAWKEGVMHFEGASYAEINNILKENYGLELYFTDPNDAESINLRGSFPTHNIEILLEAIANITHTNMQKKGSKIIYQ